MFENFESFFFIIISLLFAICAPINLLGYLVKLPFVSQFIQSILLPEISCRKCSIFWFLQKFRMINKVKAHELSIFFIVSPTCELNKAPAFEAYAVPGLCVAKIFSTFVGFSTGNFLYISQLTRFMGNLRKEHRLSLRCVYLTLFHCFIQMREKFFNSLSFSIRHYIHQLSSLEVIRLNLLHCIVGQSMFHRC
jgi:hypothetical protein